MARGSKIAIVLAIVFGALVWTPTQTAAQPGLTFEATDQGAVCELLSIVQFATTITNTGTATDTFTVAVSRDMPDDWLTSFCEGAICYPPTLSEITVILEPGHDTIVELDVTPREVTAGGTALVTVTSGTNPQLNEALDFTVITPGLGVLIVAVDSGAGLDTYYETAITAAGKSHGVWPRESAGPLDQTDLAHFGSVFWIAGSSQSGLETDDLGPLAYYIQHGGTLFMSGQDLAWAGCSPLSPHYSLGTASWFQAILGVTYVSNDGGDNYTAGVAGDPISDSFSGSLVGGSGADYNTSPDAIAASGGTEMLTYQGGATAGVRYSYGSGRTVFCAFSCENLSTVTAREDLIGSALNWFSGPSNVPDGRSQLVTRLQPNPFNPAVTIAWEMPQAAELSVVVYDIAGRHVSSLYAGPTPVGPGSVVWRGKDDTGADMPSGVYLCHLRHGQKTVTRKMTLAR